MLSPNSNKLKMQPEQFRAIGEIGAMFYEQGNLEKAQTIFEGLIEVDEESGAAHSALGALLTRKGEEERALRHLNKAIELDDRQIAPFVNRAEVYLRKQELEPAVANLKRAIALDPQEKDPGANRARAIILGIYQAMESQNPGKNRNNLKGDKNNVSNFITTETGYSVGHERPESDARIPKGYV